MNSIQTSEIMPYHDLVVQLIDRKSGQIIPEGANKIPHGTKLMVRIHNIGSTDLKVTSVYTSVNGLYQGSDALTVKSFGKVDCLKFTGESSYSPISLTILRQNTGDEGSTLIAKRSLEFIEWKSMVKVEDNIDLSIRNYLANILNQYSNSKKDLEINEPHEIFGRPNLTNTIDKKSRIYLPIFLIKMANKKKRVKWGGVVKEGTELCLVINNNQQDIDFFVATTVSNLNSKRLPLIGSESGIVSSGKPIVFFKFIVPDYNASERRLNKIFVDFMAIDKRVIAGTPIHHSRVHFNVIPKDKKASDFREMELLAED